MKITKRTLKKLIKEQIDLKEQSRNRNDIPISKNTLSIIKKIPKNKWKIYRMGIGNSYLHGTAVKNLRKNVIYYETDNGNIEVLVQKQNNEYIFALENIDNEFESIFRKFSTFEKAYDFFVKIMGFKPSIAMIEKENGKLKSLEFAKNLLSLKFNE